MTLPTKLLWIDLETTGLSPERDAILEVAFGVAPFDRPFDVAVKASMVLRHQQWSGVSREVLEMHTKSGLLTECILSPNMLGEVEKVIVESIVPCTSRDVVLAGSSVHFDRGFIRAHMPTLDELLHYRTYDVSAVRNFAYSLGMPEMPHVESAHRARQDVEASIALGRTLARWFAECGR